MNTPRTEHEPMPDAESEREWRLQERALREEREGVAPSDDPAVAGYRRVVHALRRPLPDRLPSNFAFQVAQLAARLPRPGALDMRLEQRLVRALVGAMALGAVVTAAVYGRGWLLALEAGIGSGTRGWIAAAAACVLLTWGMDGLRRWRTERRIF